MNVLTEAERIKKRLYDAKSVQEIKQVADEERGAVIALAEVSPDGRTMAIQISNLKMYRIEDLKRGQ